MTWIKARPATRGLIDRMIDQKRVIAMPRPVVFRLSKLLVSGVALVLACCGYTSGNSDALPSAPVQQNVGAPLAVFAPAAPAQPAAPLPESAIADTTAPPRMGIAGIAQAQADQGNASRGRDFAFDNCRPCHVVAPNQTSTTRFSNAPDFRVIANMPTTTSLSLIVWLTNPHPTMPSLILSPQEAADVIAYIQSLRTRS